MEPWGDSSGVSLDPPKGLGWVVFGIRLVLMAIVIFGLFGPLLIVRLIGLKGVGQNIVKLACRLAILILGMSFKITGTPMVHAGAVVANHASWLDIFTLNAAQKVYFVSKAEVQNWPVIGMLARGVGTVFIQRRKTEAVRQKQLFFERISQGERLLFFPEGTSTDGKLVLPFKPTLFAAFFEPPLADITWIQPVSLAYTAPNDARDDFYGWWGGMGFTQAFLMVTGKWKQGGVEVIFHAPLDVKSYASRKQLAYAAEQAVRSGLSG